MVLLERVLTTRLGSVAFLPPLSRCTFPVWANNGVLDTVDRIINPYQSPADGERIGEICQ